MDATNSPDKYLTGFDVAQGAPAGPPTCTHCSKQITNMYHEADGQVICSSCRAKLESAINAGSSASRFFGALGYGLAGAAVGSILWFAVLALFNMELGLLAIVVGFLVGKGVHKGSGGRGGWKYQTLAIALTYSAIVVTYIPFILEGAVEGGFDPSLLTDSMAVAGAPAGDALAEAADTTLLESGMADGIDSTTSDIGGQEMLGENEIPIGLRISALVIGAILLFILAAAAPILAGLENIIGLLIIGFALYEAWNLNRRRVINFTGPYLVGGPPAGEGAAAA